MMFVTQRLAKLRIYVAKWLLAKLVLPLASWLTQLIRTSGQDVREQHDKARMRLDVCKRCPAYTKFNTCKECGCYMPAKVQLKSTTCPQGRW